VGLRDALSEQIVLPTGRKACPLRKLSMKESRKRSIKANKY
jgi:hypothetical protein